MDIVVRPTQKSDIDSLIPLIYAYIVDFYKKPAPPESKVRNIIEVCLKQREGIQFVAQREGKLIGFATLYFSYSTTRADRITVMNDLYVIEDERGSEVSTELFIACQEYSEAHRFAAMEWITAEENHRAQRFYDKMGGKVTDWKNYSIENRKLSKK